MKSTLLTCVAMLGVATAVTIKGLSSLKLVSVGHCSRRV